MPKKKTYREEEVSAFVEGLMIAIKEHYKDNPLSKEEKSALEVVTSLMMGICAPKKSSKPS